jgi:transcriptional regulator with GAF, ATPase, and Fis domain
MLSKFREDLYYRLSTVDILLPPLRDRKDDIHLLFRKFAADFASKYKMPPLKLDEGAVKYYKNFVGAETFVSCEMSLNKFLF